MTDWVRLWHDMPTDPKWRTIARKSGQPLPCVIALFNLLMVNASGNADDRGTLRNWDNEDAAAALDMEPEDVASIMEAMEGKVIAQGRLTGWEKRQPKREDDRATLRKQAQREREQAAKLAQPDTHSDDASRTVTHCHAPDTETETDINNTNVLSSSGDDGPDLVLVKDEPSLKPEHVVEAWNDMAGRLNLSKVRKLSSARRRQLNARLREYPDVDDWTEAIAAIERSPFLQGHQSKTGWRADFDFLLQPSSFLKLIEGSYDRQSAA